MCTYTLDQLLLFLLPAARTGCGRGNAAQLAPRSAFGLASGCLRDLNCDSLYCLSLKQTHRICFVNANKDILTCDQLKNKTPNRNTHRFLGEDVSSKVVQRSQFAVEPRALPNPIVQCCGRTKTVKDVLAHACMFLSLADTFMSLTLVGDLSLTVKSIFRSAFVCACWYTHSLT